MIDTYQQLMNEWNLKRRYGHNTCSMSNWFAQYGQIKPSPYLPSFLVAVNQIVGDWNACAHTIYAKIFTYAKNQEWRVPNESNYKSY